MKLAAISRTVTIGNRSVGMLSLIGITEPGGYLVRGALRRGPLGIRPRLIGPRLSHPAAALFGFGSRDPAGLRVADGGAHGRDPPRLRLRAIERERPTLGERRRPRLAPRNDRRRVPVLDVAPAGQLDLDDHRR